MKKVIFTLVCGVMLLGSCDTYTGSGAFGGAALGGMLGSAFGGMAGGPRGSDIGCLVGAATGALVGAAAGAEADRAEASRRSYNDDDVYAYEGSGCSSYSGHNDKYSAVRQRIRNGDYRSTTTTSGESGYTKSGGYDDKFEMK